MKYQDRLKELVTAFSRLKDALPQVKNQLDKDGTIQRFEFVFELVWKTLKDYAEDKGRFDAVSPKDAFRVGADLGLIKDPKVWFEFLKRRNEATHLYSEKKANEIFQGMGSFIKSVEELISLLSRDANSV